jgi:nucleoside-diphosphate-sugar epimerase
MSKKILILGSNGFIGKNLKHLFEKNNTYDLYCLERKDFDISDKQKLNELFIKLKPNIVLNCCGIIGSSETNKKMNQYDILSANMELNTNIINCCKDNNIKKLILFSTYRIFLSSNTEKYDEENLLEHIDLNICNNNKGYLLSKIFMHVKIDLLVKTAQTDIVCFILPNIFGSYDNFSVDGRIVSSIICKISEAKIGNTDVYIHGNQNATVNLIYINDIVLIIDKCIQDDDIKGNIIILNNKTTITLLELSRTIKTLMKYKKNIYFDSNEPYIESSIMNNELYKFNKFFKNFEFTDLYKSLKETIDYFNLLTNNIC